MNSSRVEWKVGVFVALGLALAAALLIQFSKGLSLFADTYELRVRTRNVGGIQPGAFVLMAGVRVGDVVEAELDPLGAIVTLHVRIDRRFRIHDDAEFSIEQSGFLGDQYIAITPTANEGRILKDGDTVDCREPYNLQEAVRYAIGLIQRIDETAKQVNQVIARIDRVLLTDQTLTDLTVAVSNLRGLSEQARATLDAVDHVVRTNAPALNQASSNLVLFSTRLNATAEDLYSLVATNRQDVTETVRRLESAAQTVDRLLRDLDAGRGLAGTLLKNEELARHVALLSSNLAVTSSNLNRRGLWGILWKRK